MDRHDFKYTEIGTAAAERGCTAPEEMVQVTFALSVRDREALWDAAATKGFAAPGVRLSDVIDVIGPREDPAIVECVAMLAQPAAMPGCELDRFDIEIDASEAFPQPGDLKAA